MDRYFLVKYETDIFPANTLVKFETIKDMVLDNTTIETKERFQFRWTDDTKDIISVPISRTIRSTIMEKRDNNNNNYDTLPFGYSVI